MKIGRFLFGIFLLAGPNISIYDLLPDIFGYLLIYSSISKLAMIYPGVDEARDGFRALNIISGCKIAAGFLLIFLSTSNTGTFDRGWHLTFTLIFAILEVIYSFKAFGTLFEALDSAWLRFGSGKGEKVFKNTVIFTYFFIIAKNGLCLAAEMPFLSESSASGTVESITIVSAQNMRTVLSLFNVVLCIVLGLIWILQMRSYMIRFKQATFQQNAQAEYLRRVQEKPALLIRTSLNRIYSLLKIGSVFIISFTIWNINVLPSFVFGVLALWAAVLAGKPIKGTDGVRIMKTGTSPKLLACLFTLCSLIQYSLTCIFFAMYQSSDESLSFSDVISVVIEREQIALVLFVLVLIFTVLEAVTFVLFTHSLCRMMNGIAKIYTASKYENPQSSFKNEALFNSIKNAYTWVFVSAVFLGVCAILQQALIFTASIMWFVSMLASILFLAMFHRATDMLKSETETRFIYE